MKGSGALAPRALVHVAIDDVRRPPDLDAIYRAHAGDVARWSARLAGPELDPEDLVHEVFMVVAKKLGSFRGEARVTTWLYRITERVARHERRRARVRRWFGWSEVAEGALASSAPSPLDEAERRASERRLYRLLDRLRERDREVLILHEIEQLGGPAIAELLGIAPATVWVRLHRARARLRALIEAEGR